MSAFDPVSDLACTGPPHLQEKTPLEVLELSNQVLVSEQPSMPSLDSGFRFRLDWPNGFLTFGVSTHTEMQMWIHFLWTCGCSCPALSVRTSTPNAPSNRRGRSGTMTSLPVLNNKNLPPGDGGRKHKMCLDLSYASDHFASKKSTDGIPHPNPSSLEPLSLPVAYSVTRSKLWDLLAEAFGAFDFSLYAASEDDSDTNKPSTVDMVEVMPSTEDVEHDQMNTYGASPTHGIGVGVPPATPPRNVSSDPITPSSRRRSSVRRRSGLWNTPSRAQQALDDFQELRVLVEEFVSEKPEGRKASNSGSVSGSESGFTDSDDDDEIIRQVDDAEDERIAHIQRGLESWVFDSTTLHSGPIGLLMRTFTRLFFSVFFVYGTNRGSLSFGVKLAPSLSPLSSSFSLASSSIHGIKVSELPSAAIAPIDEEEKRRKQSGNDKDDMSSAESPPPSLSPSPELTSGNSFNTTNQTQPSSASASAPVAIPSRHSSSGHTKSSEVDILPMSPSPSVSRMNSYNPLNDSVLMNTSPFAPSSPAQLGSPSSSTNSRGVRSARSPSDVDSPFRSRWDVHAVELSDDKEDSPGDESESFDIDMSDVVIDEAAKTRLESALWHAKKDIDSFSTHVCRLLLELFGLPFVQVDSNSSVPYLIGSASTTNDSIGAVRRKRVKLFNEMVSRSFSACVFSQIGKPLMKLYTLRFSEACESLRRRKEQYADVSLEFLGVSEHLRLEDVDEPYLEAIQKLDEVSTYATPYEKFKSTVEISQIICRCVDLSAKAKDKGIIIGADDLLLLFTYLVLKSKNDFLPAEIVFVKDFINEKRLHMVEGYYLATIEAALQIVLNDHIGPE